MPNQRCFLLNTNLMIEIQFLSAWTARAAAASGGGAVVAEWAGHKQAVQVVGRLRSKSHISLAQLLHPRGDVPRPRRSYTCDLIFCPASLLQITVVGSLLTLSFVPAGRKRSPRLAGGASPHSSASKKEEKVEQKQRRDRICRRFSTSVTSETINKRARLWRIDIHD